MTNKPTVKDLIKVPKRTYAPVTAIQYRMIALLLNGASLQKVADECGVTPQTITQWLRRDVVREKYDEESSKLLNAYLVMAKSRMAKMLSVLEEIATDESRADGDRVRAATSYINAIFKVNEVTELRKSLKEFMKLNALLDGGDAHHGADESGNEGGPFEGEAREDVRGKVTNGGEGEGAPG